MLTLTTITIPGTPLPAENPLPLFSAGAGFGVGGGENLLPEDFTLLGDENERRWLPYKNQDGYGRIKGKETYKAIQLENKNLRAIFLPEWGGRLYSLYSKKLKKELLFSNPVLQPANLGILNAWFSGGIEWNVGRLGHAVTTCSPVFCAGMKDDDGHDYLRIYEYERMQGTFWQLDFHLLPDSEVLEMYACIRNDSDQPKPTYYWTNTAVVETPETRVFSSTDDVIYLDMHKRTLNRGKLPFLPAMPDQDASYPQNFSYSNDYYFQPPRKTAAPWEAAVYPDNWMFFERSTMPLRYRKMFCWGTHQGGKHWKDYLSAPGKGDYFEIQAGLAPTQHHGLTLAANSTIEFYQCFGGLTAETKRFYAEDWNDAKNAVEDALAAVASESAVNAAFDRLQAYRNRPPDQLLENGSGFGALEAVRRTKMGETPVPTSFVFPKEFMGAQQKPWLQLLDQGYLPELQGGCPSSYVAGDGWETLLQKSLESAAGQNDATFLHMAIIRQEQGLWKEAEDHYRNSLEKGENPYAWRGLAVLQQQQGDYAQAALSYKSALALLPDAQQPPVLREYYQLLNSTGQFAAMWNHYRRLPEPLDKMESLVFHAMCAALQLGEFEFVDRNLKKEFAQVRESETTLSDLWLGLQQQYWYRQTNEWLPLEEVEQRWPVPYHLDFRMM